MTTQKQPGYPLPSGELGNDEIVCQLVYLPNRDEYWQAFFSAYHYMTTWRAWERDSGKRGQDAAANWRESFELTMECWRMTTCFEEVTDRLDDIIAMLALKKDCCDDNITYGPGIEVETEINPQVGDPPENYGETEISDWDEWTEHVCYNANLYVDNLVWQARQMDDLLQLGGVTIGATGAGLLLLGAVGLAIAVPFAVVAATAAGILAAGTLAVFLTTADDIEDARAEIVCALIWGESVSDVIENALGSLSLDWLLFFSYVPYDSATSILYEGGYDGEFLSAETRSDCECVPTIPEGASSWPIEIVSVSSNIEDGPGWIVHEMSHDGTSAFFDLTNVLGAGAAVYMDLLVGPSPYWGVSGVGHQGIAYDGVRYTTYGQAINCEPGYLHETGEIGMANNDRWYLAVSNPYPAYAADLETYMGISFYTAGGTSGLDQDPDQNRTLRIFFWAKSGPPPGTRFQCYVEGLHWAYNKT